MRKTCLSSGKEGFNIKKNRKKKDKRYSYEGRVIRPEEELERIDFQDWQVKLKLITLIVFST